MRRALLGEFVGTFGLVAGGCGAIMADALGGELGTVGIALAFGLAVACMAWIVGEASGAHLNPAVTLGLVLDGRFPAQRALPYAGAQVAGAVAAALALRAALGNVADLGATHLRALGIASGALLEALATAFLVLVVLATARWPADRRTFAGLAAGAAVALDALAIGPLTMASMNPARSLGPALVAGPTAELAVYLAAPLAGAVLAAAVARGLRPGEPVPTSTVAPAAAEEPA
jgi:MIP family channel proteins